MEQTAIWDPLGEEIVWEDWSFVEELAEGGGLGFHLGVLAREKEDYRVPERPMRQPINTDFWKHLFILFPMIDQTPFWIEYSAQRDEVLNLVRDVDAVPISIQVCMDLP